MILFLWLVRKDKNLTWMNLQKKGWHGPGRCCLCGEEEEDNIHLFYLCPFALETLEIVCGKLHIDTPVYYLTEDCLKWWINRGELVRVIPIFFHWHIWCTRNNKLFEDILCQPLLTAHKIVNTWDILKIAHKCPGTCQEDCIFMGLTSLLVISMGLHNTLSVAVAVAVGYGWKYLLNVTTKFSGMEVMVRTWRLKSWLYRGSFSLLTNFTWTRFG